MSQAGSELLPVGGLGEIVIRGPNVMGGYLENPEANRSAFSDGWFRTGDQGFLDSDGYLTITGRLKELINRGGEKIAPREVDEALLAHPAVAQAVAFSIPDKQLGEEVAAAIVLRPGVQAAPDELQRHVAARLASFKVPRRIVVLDEIPKGPTGKLQRIGLAERLGLLEAVPPAAAKPAARADPQLEALLAELWCEILRLPVVEMDVPFIELGGDSLQATRLVNRLGEILELELSLVDFFEAATVAQQAWIVQQKLLETPTSDAGGGSSLGA
jgi:acyl carrier protein